ncbi:MAG: hypothetical protein ACRC1T_09425 [Clostridium chrysemydis]|uniref:hypothetical protein n=1 Tax=Clostridium chrysemydis TaxID=2665504 RepID=UPI003F389678
MSKYIILGIGCFLGVIFYKYIKCQQDIIFKNSIPQYFFERTKRPRNKVKKDRRW